MCELLGVSKSAYYSFKSRIEEHREVTQIDRRIMGIFWAHKRRCGSRRIREELKDERVSIGRRRISVIMKRHGLHAIQPKRYGLET